MCIIRKFPFFLKVNYYLFKLLYSFMLLGLAKTSATSPSKSNRCQSFNEVAGDCSVVIIGFKPMCKNSKFRLLVIKTNKWGWKKVRNLIICQQYKEYNLRKNSSRLKFALRIPFFIIINKKKMTKETVVWRK